MSYWSVLIPEATTNDISNPSFEVGATTGWTAFGTDTLAVSTTYQYYGRYSGKLTSASEYVFVDEFDGVSDFNCIKFASANGAESVATGTAYTLSVMLYGDATIVGKTARIRLNEVGGAVDEAILGGTATKSATVVAGWQSLTTAVGTITQADRTSIRAVLGIDSAEISDVSYWDGAQVEKKAYGTTYCDGDQAGCSWNGTALASTSTRTSQSRSGGRWKDLYDDYGFGVISMIGFGMPELRHNTTPYSILPGSYLQSIKTKERQFALIMESQGGSLTSLHTKRDYLIDAFKPDLVYPLQPVKLKYSGATTELVISAHYLEGLEGMFDGEEGVNERIAAKFVAYDPFFETANDSYVALATKQSLAGADYAIKKTNGAWSLVGSASSISGGIIRAIIVAAPDCVYLGGGFTNVGDANGDGVVKYNPITNTFTSLGIGGGTVYCMALAPNGDLYVGGIFGSMGGVANTSCMARWDGSAWNSLSATQPNNTVLAMVFDHSGNLYIGGDFTDLADANGDYISKWDGSTYSSLGIGMSGGVYALAVDPGIMVNNQFVNKVVAGGIFTAAGGVANTDKIALWNGSAWTSISSGITGTAVFSLAYGSDYALYAGGLFTVIGGTTASNIAKYVSATWYPLGSGVGSYVYRMMVAGGLLYVGGAFTSAGGLTLGDRVVTWNGTMWGLLDVDLPGSPSVYAIFVNGSETYLGYTTAGTATSSYATTTVTNTGSATSYPTISIKRSGGTSATLQWLKNETTGARLLFNYPILDGEIITIDLTQGSRGITSTYVPLGYNDDGRNIIGSILSGSSLSTWGLAPGSNTISLYISDVGSPTMTAYMIWRPKYWSVDGAIS